MRDLKYSMGERLNYYSAKVSCLPEASMGSRKHYTLGIAKNLSFHKDIAKCKISHAACRQLSEDWGGGT